MQSHYRGELYDARRKNTLSRRFSIASIVLGVVLIIVVFALILVEYFTFFKYFRSKFHPGWPTTDQPDPTPVY